MKYQETSFEEYINALEKYNMRPELEKLFNNITTKNVGNTIMYGPSGSGKYSQVLNMLKTHSPSNLKYQTKITINTEKTDYSYSISDIHYEIDMNMLGCNSKTLWHEVFLQIVDIVYTKPEKHGYIVCKNFHNIHTELLDTFYSYMQEYTTKHSHIGLNFILITEELGFIPNNIVNSCRVLNIAKPTKTQLMNIIGKEHYEHLLTLDVKKQNNIKSTIDIVNFKKTLPKDNMISICDNIIISLNDHNKIKYIDLREQIYELLTYNIDIITSIQYIIFTLLSNNEVDQSKINDILDHTFISVKYYNNNYRPIYHIESILLYITAKIHNYE
jgi:hypothetical protein